MKMLARYITVRLAFGWLLVSFRVFCPCSQSPRGLFGAGDKQVLTGDNPVAAQSVRLHQHL